MLSMVSAICMYVCTRIKIAANSLVYCTVGNVGLSEDSWVGIDHRNKSEETR